MTFRRLTHLPELQTRARDVNRRLLHSEHVGQGCVLASPAFERIATVNHRRAEGPSLKVRRPSGSILGRRPRRLCSPGRAASPTRPSGRWWPACSARLSQSRCCYDLRRLKLEALIIQLPHSNTYILTHDGQRFAIFTPNSTTGSSGHCSPPTSHPRHCRSDKP